MHFGGLKYHFYDISKSGGLRELKTYENRDLWEQQECKKGGLSRGAYLYTKIDSRIACAQFYSPVVEILALISAVECGYMFHSANGRMGCLTEFITVKFLSGRY